MVEEAGNIPRHQLTFTDENMLCIPAGIHIHTYTRLYIIYIYLYTVYREGYFQAFGFWKGQLQLSHLWCATALRDNHLHTKSLSGNGRESRWMRTSFSFFFFFSYFFFFFFLFSFFFLLFISIFLIASLKESLFKHLLKHDCSMTHTDI